MAGLGEEEQPGDRCQGSAQTLFSCCCVRKRIKGSGVRLSDRMKGEKLGRKAVLVPDHEVSKSIFTLSGRTSQ